MARRVDCAVEAQVDAAAAPAAMGRVLVGADPVADSGSGCLLGRATARVAQGNALGSGAVRARRLSTDHPGSEWRLHREWYGRTALSDLLGADETLADPHVLYECHDRLLAHKEALFTHLTGRWRDLFNVSFEVLLYDLTSTYFESDPPLDENDKRRRGYSRDHRFDCVQIVIALIVPPEGLPLAYEILPGNTNDSKTLRSFLQKIEHQYGRAQRIWCMDRGVPTEEVLAEMRRSEPPVQYLCGTPKGRLNRLEQSLVTKPWHSARVGVKVKLLPEDNELYVFAESLDRI